MEARGREMVEGSSTSPHAAAVEEQAGVVEERARVGVGDDLAYKLRSAPNPFSKQVPDKTLKL